MRRSQRSLTVWAAALACAAVLAWPAASHGWNGAGHRVIAAIAYRNLDEPTRQKVAEVLRSHPASADLWLNRPVNGPDPALALFGNASVFADEARSEPWRRYGRSAAHYVNFRILADQGNRVDPPLPGENVINSYVAHLKRIRNPRTSDADRALHLSWVFHQEGDIHQPLHAVARFSSAFPQGDRGGNLVIVPDPRGPRPAGGSGGRRSDYEFNLHSYWDGLVATDDRPDAVSAAADALTAEYPRDAFTAELARTEIRDWADESVQVAVKTAYSNLDAAQTRFADLPVGYAADARRAARRRAALAGYRLADELNRLFGQP